MNQFQVGKTYTTRSACDYDCIIRVPVISRTAKTLTTSIRGQTKTFRIAISKDGREFVRPWGNFSMAPIVDATDLEG